MRRFRVGLVAASIVLGACSAYPPRPSSEIPFPTIGDLSDGFEIDNGELLQPLEDEPEPLTGLGY